MLMIRAEKVVQTLFCFPTVNLLTPLLIIINTVVVLNSIIGIAMKCMASDNMLLENYLLKNQNVKNSFNSIGTSRHDTNNTLSSKMLLT